jgi:hypothetical protein
MFIAHESTEQDALDSAFGLRWRDTAASQKYSLFRRDFSTLSRTR